MLRVETSAGEEQAAREEKGSDKARKRPYPGNEEAHEEAISTISSTPPAKESFPKNPGGSKTRETTISPLRPLRAGERVRHFLHRHEPPTLDDPVTVLAVTDSMVAVHKPATVPVHPTGQYRKNTVLGLLAAARPDLGRLLPVHRLDKNVSGLLLMARDSASANRLREEVQSTGAQAHVALVSARTSRPGSTLETFSKKPPRRTRFFRTERRRAEKLALEKRET